MESSSTEGASSSAGSTSALHNQSSRESDQEGTAAIEAWSLPSNEELLDRLLVELNEMKAHRTASQPVTGQVDDDVVTVGVDGAKSPSWAPTSPPPPEAPPLVGGSLVGRGGMRVLNSAYVPGEPTSEMVVTSAAEREAGSSSRIPKLPPPALEGVHLCGNEMPVLLTAAYPPQPQPLDNGTREDIRESPSFTPTSPPVLYYPQGAWVNQMPVLTSSSSPAPLVGDGSGSRSRSPSGHLPHHSHS